MITILWYCLIILMKHTIQDPIPHLFIKMLTISYFICIIQDLMIIWRLRK